MAVGRLKCLLSSVSMAANKMLTWPFLFFIPRWQPDAGGNVLATGSSVRLSLRPQVLKAGMGKPSERYLAAVIYVSVPWSYPGELTSQHPAGGGVSSCTQIFLHISHNIARTPVHY